MALKPFIERELWGKHWFRSLEPHERLFFVFLITHCDNAGIWEVDLDLAALRIGQEIDFATFLEKMRKQIEPLDAEHWWLKKFVSVQYGEIKPTWRFHKPAYKSLKKHGLLDRFEETDKGKLRLKQCKGKVKPQQRLKKGSAKPRLRFLDMDMDKDRDKDKDKDRDAEEILDRWKTLTGTNDSRHEAKKWVLIRLGAKKQSKGNPVDLLSKKQMLAAIDRWAAKHAHDEKRYKVRNFFNSKKAYVMDWLKDETKPGAPQPNNGRALDYVLGAQPKTEEKETISPEKAREIRERMKGKV
jgi:hypothetical protein